MIGRNFLFLLCSNYLIGLFSFRLISNSQLFPKQQLEQRSEQRSEQQRQQQHYFVSSYPSHNHPTNNHRRTRTKPLFASSSSSSQQPFETEDTESYYNLEDLPKFDNNLLQQLDNLMDNLLSGSTMSTMSYYMLEFKNDIEYQWIMKFENCSEEGFTKLSFDEYIEKMIKLDRHELHVIMDPPKNYMKSVEPSRRNLARLQYSHMIEPRKIANQIVSVREDISNEIIVDLNSIRLEHKEAIKYANLKLRNGKEEADKQRRSTRVSPAGSTPYRDKTFYECSLLLTNIALDLLRADYERSLNHLGIHFINNVVETASQQEMDYLKEQGLTNIPGARSPNFILGDIYYRGLKDGLMEEQGLSLNTMKLAQTFLSTRLALAMEMSDLLAGQIRTCRHHYTTIKEYGGFARLDFSTPKMKIVYMDDLQAADDADAKAKAQMKENLTVKLQKEQENSASSRSPSSPETSNNHAVVVDSSYGSDPRIDPSTFSESSGNKDKDTNVVNWDNFDGFGPVSM